MTNRKKAGAKAVIGLIFILSLLSGCAGGQTASPQPASPLYLLTAAGFQKWDVNMETPRSAALYNNIPPGKIVTYMSDGRVYHVYADQDSHSLYMGDEAAYQKYLSMSHGSKLCERIVGPNQQEFWSCFQEYQAESGRPRGQ